MRYDDEYKRKLAEEILLENNEWKMTENWIDDIGEMDDWIYENNIDELIFEDNFERIEYLYRLKYGRSANKETLWDFYFNNEINEVEENYQYYKKNEITFKHGKLRSAGERHLYRILQKEKVKFVTGDADGCYNPKTKRPLKFDFIIFTNGGERIYIEIQGEQHRSYNSFFYKNKEEFEHRLELDRIKRDFANKNGRFIELFYFYGDLNILDEEIKNKLLPIIKKECR